MAVMIYDSRRRVDLTLNDSSTTANWNLPMDRIDFRIYTGVDNKVEFVLRNSDRKPVALGARKARVVFADRHTHLVLGQVYLTPINPDRGLMLLTLTKEMVKGWPVASLRYGVVIEDPDATDTPFYVDQNQNAIGFCEVHQSILHTYEAPDQSVVYNFPTLSTTTTHVRRLRITEAADAASLDGFSFVMRIKHAQSQGGQLIKELNGDNGGIILVRENLNAYLELRFGPLPEIVSDVTAFYEVVASRDGESSVWLTGKIPFDVGG